MRISVIDIRKDVLSLLYNIIYIIHYYFIIDILAQIYPHRYIYVDISMPKYLLVFSVCGVAVSGRELYNPQSEKTSFRIFKIKL